MKTTSLTATLWAGLLIACGPSGGSQSQLQLRADAASVDGTFQLDGHVVTFQSQSSNDGLYNTLRLELDGAPLDISLDWESQVLVEDAHGRSFEQGDRALLVALRDAITDAHPGVLSATHGTLLVRAADRFGQVPIGPNLGRSSTSIAMSLTTPIGVTGGCTGDGVSCLPGTSGTSWAVFSAPNLPDPCSASQVDYGDDACRGRCGMGCNWFDNDYTWDCLDHDVCLDFSNDCADEFAEAADDWAATMAPLCWGGSTRPKPPTFHDGSGGAGGSGGVGGAGGAGAAAGSGGVAGDGGSGASSGTGGESGSGGSGGDSANGTTLVINEVDYDQPSYDSSEFIELYNPTSAAVSLDGLALILFNGATSTEYRRVLLSGTLPPGGYLVVCAAGASSGVCASGISVPPGTLIVNFPFATDNIQNGAPDGVALVNLASGLLIDALSYEGAMTSAAAAGLGSFQLVEGEPTTVADTGAGALSRSPNGVDTNQASSDWAFRPATPGAANP